MSTREEEEEEEGNEFRIWSGHQLFVPSSGFGLGRPGLFASFFLSFLPISTRYTYACIRACNCVPTAVKNDPRWPDLKGRHISPVFGSSRGLSRDLFKAQMGAYASYPKPPSSNVGQPSLRINV